MLEEVKNAVFEIKSGAAPGPDGFPAIFFKEFWSTVGEDLWMFVAAAVRDGVFDPILSKTLLCLIPKINIPKEIGHFRPISLCNVAYKILTKVLVNRLRPYLSSYIGPFQSAFLPGRSTSGNAIILQEVINCLQKPSRAKRRW